MPRPEPTPIMHEDRNGRRRDVESHESWGVVVVNRVTGGTELFDSSHVHNEWIRLEIAPAERERDLHTDWIHGGIHPFIEIDMSLAQWAQLVSSFGNGSGTPVTINSRDGKLIPRAIDEPRLAVTSREVSTTAKKSTEGIVQAAQAVKEAFAAKAGRVDMAKKLRDLDIAIGHFPANMKFAADRLTEHAEDVVTKTKADIEAAHYRAARNAGIVTGYPKEIEE